MYISIAPGLLGIHTTLLDSLDLAARHGFDGVDATVPDLAALSPAEYEAVRESFTGLGLRPGYFSLDPVTISTPDEDFQAGFERLKSAAPVARELGYTRSIAVVLPFSETRPYEENFAVHVERVQKVAPILAENGISLGLEYVAPLTRRAEYEHHFVHSLEQLLTLIEAAGQPNVGLLLDSFHWYCAGETPEDIAALSKDQIVAVHLNDAVLYRPVDEQLAFERELPLASGVIDLPAFMTALKSTGYDGPLTAEPMNKALNMVDTERAAARTAAAMRQALEIDSQ